MNTKAITSNFRKTRTARVNSHRQSYIVISFQSYCYCNYNLITIVVEVLIEMCKCLRSGNIISTVYS